MPLLKKKAFQPLHVSSDFKDEDEVFHCVVTNEIFKDYNEFCERIILCNSMIWSCGITGKSNMTYEEALQCEENAKESLKEFPMELRIPILYLASKTSRIHFSEMIEDIYQFARERYFIGEVVEASFEEDSWSECHVLQVIAPSEQQCTIYYNENGVQEKRDFPPSKLYRYEVEQLDCGDTDVSQLMVVEASQVRRKKHQYSRERNKIFLKMLCEQSSCGIWQVKENVLNKYGINKIRFDSLFAGPLPDFAPRRKTVKHKQESLDKFLILESSTEKLLNKSETSNKHNSSITEKKNKNYRLDGKYKEDLKAKVLEEKARRLEERLEKKERKKEEKLKHTALQAYIRKWYKLREDLECEDLKPIPEPIPLEFSFSNEKFGCFALVLEFLRFFHEDLEVKTWFPTGLNLELLEKAVTAKEVAGPFCDLLHLLLANIFKYQDEEEDSINATFYDAQSSFVNGVASITEGIKLSSSAITWSQISQGCRLSELPIDALSISEILRQHLLNSCMQKNEMTSECRIWQQAGHCDKNESITYLNIEETHILESLSYRNVNDLSISNKLVILICLINQLLSFNSIRIKIDDRLERLHLAKKELKTLLLAEQRKEKEEKEKMKDKERDNKNEEQKSKIYTRRLFEEEKRKEEYECKLKDLQQASKNDQMMIFLGSDRAYRKYWRLLSIPGLFVENFDLWLGKCFPSGTPYEPGLQDKESVYSYLKLKFEDEFCNKENNFVKKKNSPKKFSCSEKSLNKSSAKDMNLNLYNEMRKKLMACTDNEDCPIHINRSHSRWYFYSNPDDITKIINSLNERGFRESELRINILNEYDSLVNAINDCPKYKLNSQFKHLANDSLTKTLKKNPYENVNLNYPTDMLVNDVLELTLRDYLLDLEEKIKVGGLGLLKVKDRDCWRKALSNRSYDKQFHELNCSSILPDFSENTVFKNMNKQEINETYVPVFKFKSISSVNCTDVENVDFKIPEEISYDSSQQLTIKQMACAILQIMHAIEIKYLQTPLIEVRNQWEQSLLSSTSYSQLFVHLNTLEASITWSKSAFNAQCYICRKRKDAEKMLLCDGCNKGHHLYCLKPKLNVVPEGDWFCQHCKKEKGENFKEKSKKRKHCEDKLDDEAAINKETRMKLSSFCSMCKTEGDLITCDTCASSFHLDCIEPPLSRLPRGRWVCKDCKKKKDTSNFDEIELSRQTRRSTKKAAEAEISHTKSLSSHIIDLLTSIMNHRDSWPFMSPVTVDEVPDYYDIISTPMDFGTIQNNLKNFVYKSEVDFLSDCLLVFDNCQRYNEKNSQVYHYVFRAGAKLFKYFEKRIKELGFIDNGDEIKSKILILEKIYNK